MILKTFDSDVRNECNGSDREVQVLIKGAQLLKLVSNPRNVRGYLSLLVEKVLVAWIVFSVSCVE